MAFKDFFKYFIGKQVPESYFPKGTEAERMVMPWVTVIGVLAFIFLVVFKSAMLPPNRFFYYITLAVVYIPIGVLAFIFNLTELTEKKTPWGDSSSLTGDLELWQAIVLGVDIGLLFILPNLVGSAMGFKFFTIKSLAGSTFGGLLITGILIPIIENTFFAKFLVPSMFELGGEFNLAGPIGIIVPSVIFGLIHAGSYGALSVASLAVFLQTLIFPVLFRVVTSTAILGTKSFLVALIPHLLVNSVFVFIS